MKPLALDPFQHSLDTCRPNPWFSRLDRRATGGFSYIFILSLLFVIRGHSAVYYVDLASGNDTNDGRSTQFPWHHCPGDLNVSGMARSVVLTPGDTVVFKGGTIYTNTIFINSSGTSGNPITYDGNSQGTFGIGKAILNGEYFNTYGFYGAGPSNLIFRNFEETDFGGHSSVNWLCGSLPATSYGWGIYLKNANGIVIRDSYFHGFGDWTNAPNMDQDIMEGVGVGTYGCQSITVTNCEFTQMGRAGIQVEPGYQGSGLGSTNVLIVACNFHDYIRWSIDLAAGAIGCVFRGISIENCEIHNIAPKNWLGCAGDFPHIDGIIFRIGGNPTWGPEYLGTTSQPITICNCFFYNGNTNCSPEGNSMIFLTTFGGCVLIYNNVFINSSFEGNGSIYAQDSAGITNGNPAVNYGIYNNSFYDAVYGVSLRTLSTPYSNYAITNGTIQIENNVFFKSDNSAAFMVSSGLDPYSKPTTLDYNVYYTPNRTDHLVALVSNAGTNDYVTFNQLQSIGYETHGYYINPQYANINYGLGVSSSFNNLHPMTNSPAFGAGKNLFQLFTTDMNGYLRPTATAWTIGAYQYSTNTPPTGPPAAPTGFRLVGP